MCRPSLRLEKHVYIQVCKCNRAGDFLGQVNFALGKRKWKFGCPVGKGNIYSISSLAERLDRRLVTNITIQGLSTVT